MHRQIIANFPLYRLLAIIANFSKIGDYFQSRIKLSRIVPCSDTTKTLRHPLLQPKINQTWMQKQKKNRELQIYFNVNPLFLTWCAESNLDILVDCLITLLVRCGKSGHLYICIISVNTNVELHWVSYEIHPRVTRPEFLISCKIGLISNASEVRNHRGDPIFSILGPMDK